MSLMTLREIDSKLKRMLKVDAEVSDSELSDADTVITNPIHNVLFIAFAFNEENASCSVSFTIHPRDRVIFSYSMESKEGNVKVTKEYTKLQIENHKHLKHVFNASTIISVKMTDRARERHDGGGYLFAKTYLIRRWGNTQYDRRYPYRHVTAAEIAGPIAYTNQHFSGDDQTEYDQTEIERMIDWDKLASVSEFVIQHPPIVTRTIGIYGREEITWR